MEYQLGLIEFYRLKPVPEKSPEPESRQEYHRSKAQKPARIAVSDPGNLTSASGIAWFRSRAKIGRIAGILTRPSQA